jgi:hypothetical protein
VHWLLVQASVVHRSSSSQSPTSVHTLDPPPPPVPLVLPLPPALLVLPLPPTLLPLPPTLLPLPPVLLPLPPALLPLPPAPLLLDALLLLETLPLVSPPAPALPDPVVVSESPPHPYDIPTKMTRLASPTARPLDRTRRNAMFCTPSAKGTTKDACGMRTAAALGNPSLPGPSSVIRLAWVGCVPNAAGRSIQCLRWSEKE